MKATFELKTWLSENRETVISKFDSLTKEQFYNGIDLKSFMVQVLRAMEMQNIKSSNRAASMLPFIMGNVYVANSKVFANDSRTDALKAKYEGTSFMAMV